MLSTRRALMNTSGLIAVAWFLQAGGCPNQTMTPAQIVNDANNAIGALANSLKAVLQVSPTALPANTVAQINAAIAAATSALGGLSTSLTATQAAPVVQQVEQAINTVITAAASVPLIPPPFSIALAAASVVLPILEGFVNSVLPAPAGVSGAALTARARMRALSPGMSETEAEAKLAALAGR